MVKITRSKRGYVITQDAYSPYYRAYIQGAINGRKIWVSDEFAAPYKPQDGDWEGESWVSSPLRNLLESAEEALAHAARERKLGYRPPATGIKLIRAGTVVR